MNYIEETLFNKTANFEEGQIYYNHWKNAKQYLPSVLETISHVFPHYTLHNSTHSETIINNIIKILGTSSIEQLSVVDLWLLLTSSYYHDCGMVVTGEDKRDLFKEGSDFVKYMESIQQDISSPLNKYSLLFEIRGKKLYYKNEQLTCDSYEGIRFLLADYIRNKHGERSGIKIETEKSLHLPGNPIPDRIIRILKDICSCHTKDINDVMKLQPVESSGCGIEDCHPRFIAAMLRLGDLLDVDSNRVSEVLLSTLGAIPSDSKYYNLSNRSITHIRIDKSIVEITAECDKYEVADLINRWFQCLNDELVFYMKQWHLIIPTSKFGYLPTVGDLKVNLTNYDTLDGKKRPSFDIDTNKAIELLQGAGLYSDTSECIRELLQNSVDATYLRIYKENKGINDIDEFKKLCKKYPIKVLLEKDKKDDGFVYWNIRIEDHGIGMSKEDLRYLSKTGSSDKNTEKKDLILSVPEYLWPSGTFGIGFQSVFLITDKVNIVTRKLNKDYCVRAEMYNPSGVDKGAILIQSKYDDDFDYGTTISFMFKESEEDYPHFTMENKYTDFKFRSYDFAKNEHLNIVGLKVMDEVSYFANGTFVPVELIVDGDSNNYIYGDQIEFGDIDSETGIQLYMDNKVQDDSFDESIVYYRNQCVRNYSPSVLFFKFHINILKGNAKDILTLNRDQIRAQYSETLENDIQITILKYLNKNWENLSDKQKQYASIYFEFKRDLIIQKELFDLSSNDTWKQFITIWKTRGNKGEVLNKTIDEVLNSYPLKCGYLVKTVETRFQYVDGIVINEGGTDYIMDDSDEENPYEIQIFILKMAVKKYGRSLLFSNNEILVVNDKQIITDNNTTRENLLCCYMNNGRRARGLFPCTKKYSALRIVDDKYKEEKTLFMSLDYPCMISPYIRKTNFDNMNVTRLEYDIDTTVVDTVFENRYDKKVTKEQIVESYMAFKKEWDPMVEKVNSIYSNEEGDKPIPFRTFDYWSME